MPDSPSKQKDPKQMQLRAKKKQWNATYKDVSGRLKGLKDGINGVGNTKYSVPASDIKDPLPPGLVSFLSQLAGEFSKLVSDADTIIAEQSNYSQTRRKKRPKQKQLAPTTPAPVVQEPAAEPNPLARFGAAQKPPSRLGRWWQYVKSIFSKDELNRYRVSLLRSTSDLYDQLLDMENSVLSLSDDSIQKSLETYHSVKYEFDAIAKSVSIINDVIEARKQQPQNAQQPAEQAQQNVPAAAQQVPAADNAIENKLAQLDQAIHILYNVPGMNIGAVVAIGRQIKEYREAQDTNMQQILLDRISENYEQLISSSMSILDDYYGAGVIGRDDPADVINADERKKSLASFSASKQLVKNAHNTLTRFLKKKLLKVAPFNKTVSHRLSIANVIEEAKKETVKLMNVIHNAHTNFNMHDISVSIMTLNALITGIARPLSILLLMHKQTMQKSMQKGKYQSTVSDPVFRNLMRKELMREIL